MPQGRGQVLLNLTPLPPGRVPGTEKPVKYLLNYTSVYPPPTPSSLVHKLTNTNQVTV